MAQKLDSKTVKIFSKYTIILCLIFCIPIMAFSEVRKEYYESGALKSEYTFKKGKREGLFKEYYESGALKSEYTVKNGKPEGPIKKYDENGEISIEEN